jgi:hypothetical protein
MRRWQEPHFVPQGTHLPRPITRRTTRLHPNQARSQAADELHNLGPPAAVSAVDVPLSTAITKLSKGTGYGRFKRREIHGKDHR